MLVDAQNLSETQLLTKLTSSNYIIVEGFDNVGKTTFINNYMKVKLPNYKFLQFDYHNTEELGEVPPKYRYLIGGTLNTLIKSRLINTSETPLVLDRWLVGSLAYNDLYKQGNTTLSTQVVNSLTSLYDELGILVLYMYHDSKETAKSMLSTHSVVEAYDQFESFEEYWDIYHKADILHRAYLHKLTNCMSLSTSRAYELLGGKIN